jgi:hypothetical protein
MQLELKARAEAQAKWDLACRDVEAQAWARPTQIEFSTRVAPDLFRAAAQDIASGQPVFQYFSH